MYVLFVLERVRKLAMLWRVSAGTQGPAWPRTRRPWVRNGDPGTGSPSHDGGLARVLLPRSERSRHRNSSPRYPSRVSHRRPTEMSVVTGSPSVVGGPAVLWRSSCRVWASVVDPTEPPTTRDQAPVVEPLLDRTNPVPVGLHGGAGDVNSGNRDREGRAPPSTPTEPSRQPVRTKGVRREGCTTRVETRTDTGSSDPPSSVLRWRGSPERLPPGPTEGSDRSPFRDLLAPGVQARSGDSGPRKGVSHTSYDWTTWPVRARSRPRRLGSSDPPVPRTR